jgi:hypothetical protein
MTQRRPLHPALAWILVVSMLASAWALWWPQGEDVAYEQQRAGGPEMAVPAARGGPAPMRVNGQANPSASPRQSSNEDSALAALSPAERDPFNSTPVAPPAQDKAVVTAPQAVPAAPPAPPPAPPPPMNHRVVGRFQSPEGAWLVFVQDGERAVPAAPGLALASGWVVESVTARELRLRHPQADQAVSLPLPGDNPD